MSNPIEVLKQIREIAMEHPSFDGELFVNRDQEELCNVGGEVADWTGIAILADDAIKGKK